MSNFKKIQAALSASELDALLLTGEVNRQYATGFHSSDGYVLVTREQAYYLVDSRYIEAATAAVPDAQVTLLGGGVTAQGWMNEIFAQHGLKTVGVEEESLTHGAFLRLEEAAQTQLRPAQSILTQLRSGKEAAEVAVMKRAQAIAELALDEVLGIMRPELTENQIAAELTYRMMRHGAAGNSFPPIVVAGPRSSMPHGTPTDAKLGTGVFVTMDFGCIVDGYCSDMTRTVAIGSVTDEMRRVYDTVLEAQLAGIAAARPGVPGCEIDGAARKVIADAGYGEYFGHSFGHSLGLEVHESPNAAPSCTTPMPEGAVISAEPGIYLPGRFGVRIEDTLYLHDGGAENLMKAPKNLIIL